MKRTGLTRIFLSGGCEWYVEVHPKGDIIKDSLAAYLYVANPESLRPGWKRRANYSFTVLDKSAKSSKEHLFSGCGYCDILPISKLKEEGFLEKNKLIIKVEVTVVEVVREGGVTGKEMCDVKGFQILYNQVVSVDRIFAEHPDIAVNFKPKNQSVKTAYMNVLLGLIKTLNKPPKSLSETDLSNAHSELSELAEAGFNLDWLKKKLEQVSLERKKANDDGARLQELEEVVKNLKVQLDNEKAKASKVLSLEQTVSNLKIELEKERSAKSATSKLASLKNAVCFWQRRDGYHRLK